MRRYGAKVVSKEGKIWYKKNTEASYFSDVFIDRDSLASKFSQISRRMRKLRMEFALAEPDECNLHMVGEFYANWATNARSHFVSICGGNVPITPTSINAILGTAKYTYPLVLTRMNNLTAMAFLLLFHVGKFLYD